MKSKFTFTALILLFISVSSLYAQEGTLDPSFGINGKVTTDLALDADFGQSVAVQADGKIIVGGSTVTGGGTGKDFLLVRYNTNGTLDNSFGFFGKAWAGLSGTNEFWSMAIQQDEKIVTGGYMIDGNFDCYWQLIRFKTNGSIDSTFGTNGIVITNLSPVGYLWNQGYSIAIQSDGKIIMSGAVGNLPYSDFGLARYNPDGSLDTTFGTGGKVTTDFGEYDFANCVIINSGNIIVGGDSFGNWALARYNPDGSLDNTFGTGGKVTYNFDSTNSARIWSLAAQNDGKIVAGGYSNNVSGFDLIRFGQDGSIDSTFGVNGIVSTSFLWISTLKSLQIQPDGKIIAAGSTIHPATFKGDFAMARYNTNGTLDPYFGSLGKVITDFGTQTDDIGYSAALANGKIYVAGSSDLAGTVDFALACYIGQITNIDDYYNTPVNNFELKQNYPNPFNPSTKIKYQIPSIGVRDRVSVLLKVYDVLGNEIATLVNEYKAAGSYEVDFNASALASGVYFYRMQSGIYNETKKLILIR
ncbi:MAG: T9SS type A sorting domain-containing protein [Bacteroidota bacterium]|nr:T9SS type A sorting domain-containing protein [Bacteroidota bacterium]